MTRPRRKRTHRERDLRAARQFALMDRFLPFVGWSLVIVVVSLLFMPRAIEFARAIAGTQTHFDVGLQISLIANLALAAGWTASAARSRSRRRELQEQRTMIPDDLKPEGRE